jgi:ATP-dependent helicase/nuclease subunit A
MIHRVPKPEGTSWTNDQWDAITLHGHNVLVAAAAGSGKTAVLVERIIRRISDTEQPVDVDRLLVATFTNAAAAEMRHRIREAVEKALISNPDSDHLRRQLALMGRAAITTLHSFCLDVIRKYYPMIQLDPGFRIANETESELMRQDILIELLEEWYGSSEEGSAFWRLVDWFSGERSDDALLRLVQRMYDFSRSHPWPDHWLTETARLFEDELSEESPWIDSLKKDVRLELQGAAGLLRQAEKLVHLPYGPVPYGDNIRDDLEAVGRLIAAAEHSWGMLQEAFQTVSFGRLKPCKGDKYDKELQEQVKELRSAMKERIDRIGEELFERTLEQFESELHETAPVMKTLVQLTIQFADRYRQEKAAKGLVDFADLEHYCLRILSDPASTPERTIPSQAALDYQAQFTEVLLDEYQDTNKVQETIVELISRPTPGNRFMVGDVKQSIYRFRLAEPGLFLEKYKTYQHSGNPGLRIDLARNFRSRMEVVHAVNFVFRQLMQEAVGEIAYDEKAELAFGASYYPESADDLSAELLLIDRTAQDGMEGSYGDDAAEEGEEDSAAPSVEGPDPAEEKQELETVQLEARLIAGHIHRLMGTDGSGGKPLLVFDKRTGGMRPPVFRDFVILLRATQQWAPVLIEELALQGIPAYAELSAGYFSATEVEVMMSLLKVIDNPYQDIPLAAVLRSPIVMLSADELAQVRIHGKGKAFYDAVRSYVKDGIRGDDLSAGEAGGAAGGEHGHEASGTAGGEADSEGNRQLRSKLRLFLERLALWRKEARLGALSSLIGAIQRETGYYDFVGGMPGGLQRQANLRALYDRARQYEATSFRGLFRFLRFIERMKDTGGDLGAARALGEQEDVVRIMSIHKSKGLEFPVVYVAGLGKLFNQTDLNDTFLLHKELGFGPRFVDTELRVGYPTLPALAIRRRMRMETLAEEMRVLYVALTRAREKLVLIGSARGLEKQLRGWARQLECETEALPEFDVAKARCYLDWLGPAVMRHPHAEIMRHAVDADYPAQPFPLGEASQWQVRIIDPRWFFSAAEAAPVKLADSVRMDAVFRLEPIAGTDGVGGLATEVARRFEWAYPYPEAQGIFSKTSVTELKRIGETSRLLEDMREDAADWLQEADWRSRQPAAGSSETTATAAAAAEGDSLYRPVIVRRPRFMEQKRMNAAERGTLYHAVMQRIPLAPKPDEAAVMRTVAEMVGKELMKPEQAEAVQTSDIASFFTTSVGLRLLDAVSVHREIPFSYGLKASEVYANVAIGLGERSSGESAGALDDTVMIQGVIDCLFEEPDGLVLLDFKTDALQGRSPEFARDRYKLQLDLYARAVEHIWKRPVIGKYLYLFDGAHVVEL